MSAIDQLDSLKSALPELFQDRKLKPGWDDGYIIIAIDDPDYFPVLENDNTIARESEDFDSIDDWPEPLLSDTDILEIDQELTDIFSGSHAGAPVAKSPVPSVCPPPDSLAFYLPFHYYHPTWWGIYLRVEGVEILARDLRARCSASLTWGEARRLSRIFLYYHEAFHHKTESLATRLEVTHRKPFYKTGFERLYQDTVFKTTCLEETLAEASALVNIGKRTARDYRKIAILTAFDDIVRDSPPGYAEGAGMRESELVELRRQFAEQNENYCLPHIPKCAPEIWATATHIFNPLANIKSRVNYILPRSSPLAARLPFLRPLMPPREVRKKLKKLVGLKHVRTGKHPIYETDSGRTLAIPEHPRDVKKGTLDSIIKQAGLSMTVREFQET